MTTKIELSVPFVDLTEQYALLKDEIDAAIAPIFSAADFVLGRPVQEFERSFAAYCGSRFCISVHSGTAALHLALLALDVGPGDEVITATNSFIATAEAISFCGATPRLVDVDPHTYNLDPAQVEMAINKHTKALLPVHLYGQPADMHAVLDIAKQHGLSVVEDACQAHGALYKGAKVGSLGDIGCFSFYPGKNLGTAGDGGAIVTNDESLARKMRLLRNHGSEERYKHEIIGHNFRLDNLQAAILSVKLKYLDEWNQKRQRLAASYTAQLKSIPGVITPRVSQDSSHIFHLYVVQVEDRAKLQAAFAAQGVGSGIHYPVPIHLQQAYKQLDLGPGSFPTSEALMNKILSLPIFPELKDEQQKKVIDIVQSVARAESWKKSKGN